MNEHMTNRVAASADHADGTAAVTSEQERSEPPPELVAAAERDYRETRHDLEALIAGTRAVRSQHDTELNMFIHLYATIRRTDSTRATALAALAVLQLADESATPTKRR
jgi:hypothetical protein